MRYFSVNVRREPTEYGFMPTLQLYLLEENDKQRPIVIIAPGGGYSTVLTDCDGDRVASQYNAAGFHAAVLRYSVRPHCFPEPQKDLMLAIRLLRENAAAWGIREDGIVLCGFSAGGHLAASVSTLWHRSGESIYRPNAAILCYSILTARLNHCRQFLEAHVGGSEEKLKLASCDEQVSRETPPTFLYGTWEDKLTNVENILYYAEMLRKNDVPFELHIFPRGEHGASWCDGTVWAKPASGRNQNYIQLSVEWLRERFGWI